MQILITGAHGFIAKNLICELKNRGYDDLCLCHRGTSEEELDTFTKQCDFIFHLAGVNRPDHVEEFLEGNVGFTEHLIQLLKKHRKKAPIVCTSSTQATLDNPYGSSKLKGEKLLLEYADTEKANVFIVRLTNVFGKWCKPNYNSVIATFCHNIACSLPIKINDKTAELNLIYIDDVVNEFIKLMENECGVSDDEGNRANAVSLARDGRYYVHTVYTVTLGQIAELLQGFKESRTNLEVPDMMDGFTKKLYSTYLSYLPENEFSYPLKMNVDHRGSFTEMIKSSSFGQVSVNISKTGITKGNHWHHTKNEKFLVVSGQGIIRFRKVELPVRTEAPGADKKQVVANKNVIEYKVSGDRLEVIDIPPGYTHNITNTGPTDMVTIMWANESFDLNKPDTYYLEV